MGKGQSDLGYIKHAIDCFHTYWEEEISNQQIILPRLRNNPTIILFMSIGNATIRANVHHVVTTDLRKAMDQLRDKAVVLVRKKHMTPEWIKFDLVTDIQEISFEGLE